ncbi:MAG: peptidylprolyl isomerase, partial [Erysipelotrichales bacterium]
MEKEFASYGVDNKASYIKKADVRLGALRELAAIDTAAQKLFKQEEIDYIYDNKFSGTAKISSILIEPKMSAKDNGNNGLTDKAKAEANKEAEKVISEIKGGLSFKDAYNKYSADKTLENGYIGTFNVEQAHTAQLENPVIKEAFSLKDKTSSTTPVETSRGYEIISVEYTVPKKSFEDVKNDVNKMLFDLYQGNNNFTREYVLDQFRADEKIEITDEVQSKQHANSVLQNRKSYTTFDPEAQNNGLNYGY